MSSWKYDTSDVPERSSPQSLPKLNLEVSPAHDWDGWLLDHLAEGYVEDAPLTYRWTVGKGHFLVEDEKGNKGDTILNWLRVNRISVGIVLGGTAGTLHRSSVSTFTSGEANLIGRFTGQTSFTDNGGLLPKTKYYYSFVPSEGEQTEGRADAITLPPPTKQWDVGEAIKIDGEITSDVTPRDSTLGPNTRFVYPGQIVTVTMAGASDKDHWTLGEGEEQTSDDEADTLTYEWTQESLAESGELSDPTSSETQWTVPIMMGDEDSMTVTLKCTVKDTPKALGEGEGGSRDDGDADKSIDFQVVRKKWEPGDKITIEGDIKSDVTPQTSTEGLQVLFVSPGQEVNLTMAEASDIDRWVRGEESGTDEDTLTYEWEETSLGESGQLFSPTSRTTKWTVPMMTGNEDSMTVTIKCTVKDTPKVPGPTEAGDRDDGDAERSLDFKVVRKKWLADPAIGQHPKLDENGQFDPKNITWVKDGEIIAPKPEDAPHQVFTGAKLNLEVSPAHDWDGWVRDLLDEGYVEDAPLTYRWTAGKGHFLVEDEEGNLKESSSASGLKVLWVAPAQLDTSEEDVEIKCTIDDPAGARIGATEAGTRDDEKLERTVSVTVVKMKVTFENQLARSCAGGVAVDGVHDFTIKGTATLPDGTFPPTGTEFKLVFENNKGHDYSGDDVDIKPAGWTTEDIRKAKFVTTDANGNRKLVEEMTVRTDENGKFPVQVLSSDIISEDITIKVKRVSDDGQETDVGEKECDFAEAVGYRRFPDRFNPNSLGDIGWLFNTRWLTPGVQTTAKIYMKFEVVPNGNDLKDNWKEVNGHQMKIYVESIDFKNNLSSEPNQDECAIIVANRDNGLAIHSTANDGAATALLKAKEKISDADVVWIGATDLSQWDN